MVRKMIVMMMVLAIGLLVGCGGGGGGPALITGQVLSDQRNDGDITSTGIITAAAANRNVLFGVSPGTEYRAFLDFPLNGTNGGSVIPVDARVASADLTVFVNSINVAAAIPTLLDLVAYSSTTGPVLNDYNSATLTPTSFRSLTFLQSTDVGNFVRIDVTPLVQDALVQGVSHVQFRFLYDFVANPNGIVELADGAADKAPLLTITYQ
ncbi:MAG TPA: hypothetical protein VGK27_10080 [Candidatus Deferrimicrobiaceae bacterium]|jgi:hypothetical protein